MQHAISPSFITIITLVTLTITINMRKKLQSLPFAGYDNKDVLELRTIVRSIKFSCKDLEIARKRMAKAGYENFSTFGRDCILSAQIVERITPEQQDILRELLRERNNINQIAKACNAGKCWSVASKANVLLNKLDEIIDRFNEIKS